MIISNALKQIELFLLRVSLLIKNELFIYKLNAICKKNMWNA